MTYYTISYLVGFIDLVSAVGGALGLFTGFSLLATLTAVQDALWRNQPTISHEVEIRNNTDL